MGKIPKIKIGGNIAEKTTDGVFNTTSNTSDINDIDNLNFDHTQMDNNLKKYLKEIDDSLTKARLKVESLNNKEGMLNKIITSTNAQLENTSSNNPKLIGVLQSIFIKQLESLNMINEAIIRYEDLIQRYVKIKIDIENQKLGAYIKIKAANKTSDKLEDDFTGILDNLHKISQDKEMLFNVAEEAQRQLKIQNY